MGVGVDLREVRGKSVIRLRRITFKQLAVPTVCKRERLEVRVKSYALW